MKHFIYIRIWRTHTVLGSHRFNEMCQIVCSVRLLVLFCTPRKRFGNELMAIVWLHHFARSDKITCAANFAVCQYHQCTLHKYCAVRYAHNSLSNFEADRP